MRGTIAVVLATTSALLAPGIAEAALPTNTAPPGIGRADGQDQYALDVGQGIVATPGTWSDASGYAYRFWRCPDTTLDPAGCTSAGWQSASSTTFDASSAGQYAIVEVRATNGEGTSNPAASAAKLLTIPPRVGAAGIHVTGGLADGTVAPHARIDASVDPTAVTGVPAPATTLEWSVASMPIGGDAVMPPSILAYGGPFDVGAQTPASTYGIAPKVTVSNPGGSAVAYGPTLERRRAPLLSYSCFCATSAVKQFQPRVGRQIRMEQMADGAKGKRAGLPPIRTGLPTPTLTLQWLRCTPKRCSSIKGADATSYVPTRKDAGRRIRLQLTLSNALGTVRQRLTTPKDRVVAKASKRKR